MPKLLICCFLVALCLITDVCHAQQPVNLKKVNKFVFIFNGPAASFFTPRNKIEIVLEDKLWKCYQTLAISEFGTKRDTQRRYIKDANKSDIRQLLKIINKADTTLRLKNFSTDKKLLVKYIDSVSSSDNLPIAQRPAFIEFLKNDKSLKRALFMALQKMGHSDYSYQYVYIVTKRNDTIKTEANSSKVFYLPWHIGNKINYDPHIDMIFQKIVSGGNNKAEENKALYKAICKCAYMLCFHQKRDMRFFCYKGPKILTEDFQGVK